MSFNSRMKTIKKTLDVTRYGLLVERGIGVALILLGLVVIAGWVLHLPALVEIKSGLVPMVFNTGLCFVLSGTAILVMPRTDAMAYRLRKGIGWCLITLCG